jgi:hypothetical protein
MHGRLVVIAAAGLLAASTANGFAQSPRDYGYGRQGAGDDTRMGDRDRDQMGGRDDMRSGGRDDMSRERPGMGTDGMGGERDRQ